MYYNLQIRPHTEETSLTMPDTLMIQKVEYFCIRLLLLVFLFGNFLINLQDNVQNICSGTLKILSKEVSECFITVTMKIRKEATTKCSLAMLCMSWAYDRICPLYCHED